MIIFHVQAGDNMNKSKIFHLSIILSLLALVSTACSEISTSTTSTSGVAESNFRLLISDDANAIEDFASVNVTISKIGVHSANSTSNWTEFVPDITEVDLKPLVGENALEIWSGNLTTGEYNKVFIYVNTVTGILNEELGGEETEIKLPSNKLQISKPFTISDNETTSFVYDVTVVKAGNSGRYILQPQIAQSGAKQEFKEIKNQKEPKNKGDVSLENTNWALDSYGTSDNLSKLLEDTEITIRFIKNSGEFQGSSGCNSYFGNYEVDGNLLTIQQPIGQTEIACTEPIMEQEVEYLAILQDAESYEITDDQLQIICGDRLLNYIKD